AVKEYKKVKINQDFKPIGYFYHASLWMTLFHSGKGILPFLEKINLSLFILILIILFFFTFLIQKFRKTKTKMSVILSIGTTGMSEISFQIIVIFAFQFLYGYMYYRIGLILTSFMIGLVLGAYFINRVLEKVDEKSFYLKTQIFICAYPLILPIILILIAKTNITRPNIGGALQLSFAFLPIIAGFLGGIQFPLANKICLKGYEDVGKTTGLLYSVDLFGACVGGILIGLLFVPILGIIQTCVLLSVINLLVLILLKYTL
ncbi:MAG: hypothetical protein H8D54_03505, partial [Candidatus Omnitrophica bacterium]|nr:hypothetical protein [Candidatus Omnitrophota bacterium]